MMYKTVDFSKYSSIRIGAAAKVRIIDKIESLEEGVFLVGGANNLLISPNPPKLAMLSSRFDYIKEEDGIIKAGGATVGGKLLSYAQKNNLANFELLQKLPGKIGGIVKMNAGLKEFCISDNLLGVVTEYGVIARDKIKFSYRNSEIDGIIYEAWFEKKDGFDSEKLAFFKKMRANQPKNPSAGSCFKNPPNDYAGRLLEAVGFRDKRVGNMAFSDVHANFLINLGGGTFEEALELIEGAKRAVLEQFGVKLELEIKIVGL